jgi:hypothetical protein
VLDRHRERVLGQLAELTDHLHALDSKIAFHHGTRATCD